MNSEANHLNPATNRDGENLPKPAPEREAGPGVWQGLALLTLVGLAYWPSIRGGFVWDDLVLVKNNPLATGVMNLKTVWLGADFSLSTVVLWLEWLVFRDEATGYRIVNLLLHSGSVLLVWRLLVRLAIPGAWLGAAIFAVHPVAVASVAWISELKNTLSLPFVLLSAHAFLAYEERRKLEPAGKASWCYAAAVITFGLALLAKTSAVVLPILLLGGLAIHRRITRRDGVALAPFFGMALGFGLMTIWFQTHQAIRGVSVQTGGWLERWADAGTAVWFYLGKALWPVGLCAIYPGWEKALPGLWRLVPLLALGLGFVGAMFYRRSWGKWVGLSLGAFTVCVLPVAGLVDMYFMVFARVSDHFAYLPLVIVAGAIGALVSQVRHRTARIGLAVLMVGSLVGLTQIRARVYASDEALWRDTVRKNPQAWNAHNNLACNLAERGQLELAIHHFQESLALNPKNAAAQLNLARGLTMLGRFATAETHYQRAIELKPEDPEARMAYGQALAENRRLEQAITQLQKAVELKPQTQTRLLLANLLAALGRLEPAAAEYQQVLEVEPTALEALNNRAWILATAAPPLQRNGVEALRLARQACELTAYQQPLMLSTLAAAFAETQDYSNAIVTAEAAIRLATAQGKESLVAQNRRLLREYRAGRSAGTKPQ